MNWLLAFLVVHLVYELNTDSVEDAAISTAILVASSIAAHRLGNWTSPRSAWYWLLVNKQSGLPIAVLAIGGPVLFLVLAVLSEKLSLPAAAIESVGHYVFFHGIAAVWFWFLSKLPFGQK